MARPLTVRHLVDDQSLGLRLVAGIQHAGSSVRSAHATDLDHPERVLPGDLILTNGRWLSDVRALDWVGAATDALATAIGFGLSDEYPAVPEELITACEALETPLLEVPPKLSFSAIYDVIRARTDADATLIIRRQLIRTRRVLNQLVGGEGHAILLDVLQSDLSAPAAFVGPGGRVIASSTDEWPPPALARRAAAVALRGALPSAIGSEAAAFGYIRQPPMSTLLVATALNELGDDIRLLLEQVAALAAFEDARRLALEEARRSVAEEFLRALRADELGDSAFDARMRALQLAPDQSLFFVAADVSVPVMRYAAEACAAPYALADGRDWRITVVQAPPPAYVDELSSVLDDLGGGRLCVSEGVALGAAASRRALAEVEAALSKARWQVGESEPDTPPDAVSHALLLDLLEPAAVATYRDAVLRPLEDWDREHETGLVTTLRMFLELGGRWRETAEQLHIHHNTLRYRLSRVEALTGRSLAKTADRVDLYLALRASDSIARTNV